MENTGEWFDNELDWENPEGTLEAAPGMYPQWTVRCGNLTGGPFVWVLRDSHQNRWRFLDVSRCPTQNELMHQLIQIVERDVADEIIGAVQLELHECITDVPLRNSPRIEGSADEELEMTDEGDGEPEWEYREVSVPVAETPEGGGVRIAWAAGWRLVAIEFDPGEGKVLARLRRSKTSRT